MDMFSKSSKNHTDSSYSNTHYFEEQKEWKKYRGGTVPLPFFLLLHKLITWILRKGNLKGKTVDTPNKGIDKENFELCIKAERLKESRRLGRKQERLIGKKMQPPQQ